MPSRLLINADDFGLTAGVNRAMIELHQAGVLTSATLMATGSAFDDAVALAKANPTLGVGCHIVLVDGVPAAAPEQIPTLLGADGRHLRSSLIDFVRDLLLGRIREEEIEIEARAQIRKIKQAGLQPTHVDSHKHSHMFPQVTRPLLRALIAESIHAIRNPFEPAIVQQLNHAGMKRRLQVTLLSQLRPAFLRNLQATSGRVTTPDGTIGLSATGNLTPDTLAEVLRTLPSQGVYELVCHPGYNDRDLDRITTRLRQHREVEMEALLTALPPVLAGGSAPSLLHFGDLFHDDARSPA